MVLYIDFVITIRHYRWRLDLSCLKIRDSYLILKLYWIYPWSLVILVYIINIRGITMYVVMVLDSNPNQYSIDTSISSWSSL